MMNFSMKLYLDWRGEPSIDGDADDETYSTVGFLNAPQCPYVRAPDKKSPRHGN